MKRGNLSGPAITEIRKKLGYNITELAAILTISQSSMWSYEANRRVMPDLLVRELLRLAKGK
jgi:transcriptional regulator with XRE-family HTH domain